MHRIVDELRRDEERVLDRLVDGEMADADRRALLSALDDEPGAWRRCALAFLESQTLRGDLRLLHAQADADAPRCVQPDRSKSSRRPRWWELGLTMAACALLAFGGGLVTRQWWTGLGSAPTDALVDRNVTGVPSQPVGTDAASRRFENDPQFVTAHKLRLGFGNDAGAETIEVPIVSASELDPGWFARQPSAVPDDVLQALQDSGHRVRRGRQLWPIELNDGRRLFVPVEQVDVQQAERPTY